ncbi:MAG: hypothetical protein HYZ49_19080 [Chloroflexi bacterium]|jgi:hypothetical protein|nr:hypothetical protein [Chloroflexota bacterium]
MTDSRNSVNLIGQIRLINVTDYQMQDNTALVVNATIDTGPVALGGRHKVILSGFPARKILAFFRAASQDELEGFIRGELFTVSGATSVKGDVVDFFVPKEIARKAQTILEAIEPPESRKSRRRNTEG